MLVKALPSTITEMGLVQCNIGDEGGEALLTWASNTPTLQMLCIEQNVFSKKIKDRFVELGSKTQGLFIVI